MLVLVLLMINNCQPAAQEQFELDALLDSVSASPQVRPPLEEINKQNNQKSAATSCSGKNVNCRRSDPTTASGTRTKNW